MTETELSEDQKQEKGACLLSGGIEEQAEGAEM